MYVAAIQSPTPSNFVRSVFHCHSLQSFTLIMNRDETSFSPFNINLSSFFSNKDQTSKVSQKKKVFAPSASSGGRDSNLNSSEWDDIFSEEDNSGPGMLGSPGHQGYVMNQVTLY